MKVKKPNGGVIALWKLRTLVSLIDADNRSAKHVTRQTVIPSTVLALIKNMSAQTNDVNKELLETTYQSLLPSEPAAKNNPVKKIEKRIRSISYQLSEVMSLMTNSTARKSVEALLDFDQLINFPIESVEALDDFSVVLINLTNVIIPDEVQNLKDALDSNKTALPIGKVSRRVFKLMTLVSRSTDQAEKDLIYDYVKQQEHLGQLLIKSVCIKTADRVHLTAKRKHEMLKMALWQPMTIDQLSKHLKEIQDDLVLNALSSEIE